ncbi:MAG: methyl-accepting chemotaxis protein [Proteobacteria bacterium]|nr:methyl-accepting chemotaxis protein [Pseudomonadota bacterium]
MFNADKFGFRQKLVAIIAVVSATIVFGGVLEYRTVLKLIEQNDSQNKIVAAQSVLKEIQQSFADANLLGMDIIVDHHEDPSKKVQREDEFRKFFAEVNSKRPNWNSALTEIGVIEQSKMVFDQLEVLDKSIASLIAAINSGETRSEVYAKFDEAIDGANTDGSAKLAVIAGQVSKDYETRSLTMSEQFESLARTTGMIFAAIILLLWGIGIPVVFSMTKEIHRLRSEMKHVTGGVTGTSRALSETANNLADAASQSSAAIQQSVSAMAEMGAMLSQTARNAHETSELSRGVLDQSQHGAKVMSEMSNSMKEISDASSRLKEIVRVIEDITAKTTVINDVVFKTQLLAVNASIEAARAGQHGKGFAVVANEVASLAALSGKASNEIRELLSTSSSKVHEIIEGTSSAVRRGESVNQRSSNAFMDITNSIGGISDRIDQISAASREQEAGVSQTTAALSQLNHSTNSINEMAQKNAAYGSELLDHGGKLRRIDHTLAIIESGAKRDSIKGGHPSQTGSMHSITSLANLKNHKNRTRADEQNQFPEYDDSNEQFEKSA